MGIPRSAKPVKLICGLLAGDDDLLRRARHLLIRSYGPVDVESEIWPFTYTNYYTDEMGPNLRRKFLAFEQLIRPDHLAEIKRSTNNIETEIAEQTAALDILRPLNLDPGYVDLGKLVLASTKDHAHRVYLGQGIYAEVTLAYVRGAWTPWPWTYPDYKSPEYAEYFVRVRNKLHDQLAEWPTTRETPSS